MWMFTTIGFFSVIQHPHDPESVLVRARSPEDLLTLKRRYLPALEVVSTPNRNYKWRASCPKHLWSFAAARLAGHINYGGFETAVAKRQTPARAALYGEVFHKLGSIKPSI